MPLSDAFDVLHYMMVEMDHLDVDHAELVLATKTADVAAEWNEAQLQDGAASLMGLGIPAG